MSDTLSNTTTTPILVPVDQADYAALLKGSAYWARPNAGVLRLTGEDRHDFLQRMTTNNIAVLRPGQSAVTVLTSPTARILYVFTVIARSDDLVLLPAPEQASALARHLRGQIFFMDKVKVEELSAEWARLRIMGPQAAQPLAKLGVEVSSLVANAVVIQDDLLLVAQPHYETPGYELIVPAANLTNVTNTLAEAGAEMVSEAAVEARRVELGRPSAGAELVEEYTPLEAGLAWACAENKGCYTGQEIIARQITYDKVTKALIGLRLDAPVAVGSEVSVEGRAAGTITSVAYSPSLDAPVALAIVKRPHNAPGTIAQIGEQNAIIVALPFVTE